jgi:dihydroflavonol-4-reductase
MMKAFVTGATGFVGSAVVRSLLVRGVRVKALVRGTSDMRNLSGLDVETVQANLLDEDELIGVLRGCDTLYHVAAFYSTAEIDGQKMYEINVRGTKTVMRAAVRAGVQRVVHTSTIGTIGQPFDGTLATEETLFNQWETSSHYAKSKYLAEVVALRMCDMGLRVVVVNPCAPVGARDIKPSSTGLRILDYLHGRVPSFAAGGINFVSVQDVAEGHILAADKGRTGERYLLGNKVGNLLLADFLGLMERVSGIQLSLASPDSGVRRIARRAKSALRWRGRTASAQPDGRVQDHRPAALTCDPSKAIRELGLPQTPLTTAFAEAVSWFRENGYVCTRE